MSTITRSLLSLCSKKEIIISDERSVVTDRHFVMALMIVVGVVCLMVTL